MNPSQTIEVNFDGLVGPTHNYAGLAHGNIASTRHRNLRSNPKRAALEALNKIKTLMSLGIPQAVLPPQHRPDIALLRSLGFSGSDKDILAAVHRDDPRLLATAASASSMWAANAATVSPSPDTNDHRLHITPANLIHNLHRSIESASTTRTLRAIFRDDSQFVIHDSLPASLSLCDEGAANHTRLCAAHGSSGLELFTFDRLGMDDDTPLTHYPRRQTLHASRSIACLHQLRPDSTLFIQQNPVAIDAGVFHNDVIAVGHRNILLCHEHAFVEQPRFLDELRTRFRVVCGGELRVIQIAQQQLSLNDAVHSYFFNSQILTTPDGQTLLLAPAECEHIAPALATLRHITSAGSPIQRFEFIDVRQSMQNGGGPACLRLRIVLTPDQYRAAHQGIFLTDALHTALVDWVHRHYRDDLGPDDLADPHLLLESKSALDDLTRILALPDLYDFQ